MKNFTGLFSNKITSIIITVIACALWGSLYPFVKIGYSVFQIEGNDIPAIMLFASCRFTISGLILFIVFSAKNKRVHTPVAKGVLKYVLFASLTSIVLHYLLTYTALSFGEGSKSAIIKQVGFLFLSCFAFLFIKDDKFSVAKLVAGILGFLGIIVTNFDGGKFTFGLGDAFLILASGSSVVATVISKKIINKINPLQLVAYSQFFGGVILYMGGLLLGGRITHIDTNSVLVFAYICVTSITAYSLWNMLIKYNDLSKLSVIKFTEPLFAVVFSGMLLGEDIFKLNYLIAFIIILVAILLVNKKHKRRSEV